MQDFNIEVRPTAGDIACNFDDIKVALENQMQAYEELEVTEDNIKERKGDVATLRKIKKFVDDKRKEVEAEYDKPLVEFKARVKELTGVIDTQIDRITGMLDGYEKARVVAKQEHIQKLYEENIGEYAEYLPLAVIKSPKWDNKTYSDNDIVSEIQERKLRVKNDLDTIRALNSPIEQELITAYKTGGNNLTSAINKHTAFTEAKALAEAEVRREVKETVKSEPRPVYEPTKAEPMMIVKVTGEAYINEVRNFLEFNQIPYEEVRA